jgi:hypothetical protein
MAVLGAQVLVWPLTILEDENTAYPDNAELLINLFHVIFGSKEVTLFI